MELGQPTKSHHIIIIDDDPLVRNFTLQTMEFGTNQHVKSFESGFQGWQYIKSQPFLVDIVIADANIPDMNGLELLKQVKALFPQKVFILTSSDPADEQDARQLRADAFLSKPFDARDLFVIIQELILTLPSTPKPRFSVFHK